MSDEKNESGAKVPVEKVDPKAAKRPPDPGAKDRPGFDLGGATDKPDSPNETAETTSNPRP